MADVGLVEEGKGSDVSQLDKEEIELPSTITDRWRIFMPRDKTNYDPTIYGKWMWFSGGDFNLQDQVWISLQPLLDNKCALLLESSTARKSHQGVIKCYTGMDKKDIMEAGLAFQNIVSDNSLLFYKTAEASKDGLNRRLYDRFISKYMLTVNKGFYERDDLDRWKRINDDSSAQEHFHSREMYLPSLKRQHYTDMKMLPSEESNKGKYSVGSHATRDSFEPVGMWHLFCGITDFDSNGMTELDRNWIQVMSLYKEKVFIGASVETNAYFYASGDANFQRRTITCDVRDYMDVKNVMETGRMLIDRCNYSFPFYMKTLRPEARKAKFILRYMLTEDGDLYEFIDDHWKFLQTS